MHWLQDEAVSRMQRQQDVAIESDHLPDTNLHIDTQEDK